MELSLDQLIHQRMQELGIGRAELARRMGYANIAKGCRRIDEICGGHVEMAKSLRVELSKGLEVEVGMIDKAIEVTRAQQIAAEDRAYRESFKPHAVILTKEQVPSLFHVVRDDGGRPPSDHFVQGRIIPENVRSTGARSPSERGSLFRASNRVCVKPHS